MTPIQKDLLLEINTNFAKDISSLVHMVEKDFINKVDILTVHPLSTYCYVVSLKSNEGHTRTFSRALEEDYNLIFAYITDSLNSPIERIEIDVKSFKLIFITREFKLYFTFSKTPVLVDRDNRKTRALNSNTFSYESGIIRALFSPLLMEIRDIKATFANDSIESRYGDSIRNMYSYSRNSPVFSDTTMQRLESQMRDFRIQSDFRIPEYNNIIIDSCPN